MTMLKHWDHSIVLLDPDKIVPCLADMGGQGWELVQISRIPCEIGVLVKTRLEKYEAIFKREKLTYLPNPYDTSINRS